MPPFAGPNGTYTTLLHFTPLCSILGVFFSTGAPKLSLAPGAHQAGAPQEGAREPAVEKKKPALTGRSVEDRGGLERVAPAPLFPTLIELIHQRNLRLRFR